MPATTSQTVGPFFHLGCAALYCTELAGPGVSGERVRIQGRVLDGDGQAVPDAILEVWQADAAGRYAQQAGLDTKTGEHTFFGFGRIPTEADGNFQFSTIKPGSVSAPDGTPQAPHIVVSVFARGLLTRLVTRIYFSEEPLNDSDFVLGRVEAGRRETLMAKPINGRKEMREWNVILQGPDETVFFDL
ncbi:MAG TPA: protocatechuate 3,4-dioxygenase subunit alpha [Candidatus Acidoferrum sp.]